jgi:hypothetical protein
MLSSGLVATPEQEEETRRLQAMLGQGQQLPVPVDAPSMSMTGLAGARQALMGAGGGGTEMQTSRAAVGTGATTPGPNAVMHGSFPGKGVAMAGEWENSFPTMSQKPQRAPWEQSKRDKWAQALAAIGTSFGAVQASMDGDHAGSNRMMENLRANFMQQRQRAQLGQSLRNMGYNDDQIMVALENPEAVSRNYAEGFGTRVVAPGSAVIQGTPQGQQQQFRQPNEFEQYAAAQGYRPGSEQYNTAAQDYVLRGNGPTAYNYDQQLDEVRTANDIELEGERQQGRLTLEGARQNNRVGLEGVRQDNRVTTRQTPTYRDMNPPAPRAPRAAAARPTARKIAVNPQTGEKMELVNGQWRRAQ